MEKQTRNKNLGSKWFIFYTRIRPFVACFSFAINGGIGWLLFEDAHSNLGGILCLIGAVTGIVLNIMMFIKSFGDYRKLVSFIDKELLFEIAFGSYMPWVLSTDTIGVSFISFIIAVIVFVVDYFTWYKWNMNYFEKRISHLPSDFASEQKPERCNGKWIEKLKGIVVLPVETQAGKFSETPKIIYCRKCGKKLSEEAHFCKECGTEIILKVEEISDAL